MGTVSLTWHEAAMAAEIGTMRQLASIRRDRRDAHGFCGEGWSEHIEGACGELALAKYLNIHWDGSVDAFLAADLPFLQVRTRSRHDYDLIVRERDGDDETFVLLTGRCPHYRVRGWIAGHDAKRPEWLAEHGGRPPAYFVPADALAAIETLPRYGRV